MKGDTSTPSLRQGIIMSTIKCPDCGRKISSRTAFNHCPHCGCPTTTIKRHAKWKTVALIVFAIILGVVYFTDEKNKTHRSGAKVEVVKKQSNQDKRTTGKKKNVKKSASQNIPKPSSKEGSIEDVRHNYNNEQSQSLKSPISEVKDSI